MNVTVDTTVSYSIKTVKVGSISLTINHSGALLVSAPFAWYDADGKLLRNGSNTYTEAQLLAAMPDAASALAILKSLVPDRGNYNVIMNDTGVARAIKGYPGKDDAGRDMWISENLTSDQFAAAIAPVTIDQFKTMIGQFTATIFA